MPVAAELRALARLLLRGDRDPASMQQRVRDRLGSCPRPFVSAIRSVLRESPPGTSPTEERVVAILASHAPLQRALARHRYQLHQTLHPASRTATAWRWPVHPLGTAGDLAHWLELEPGQLLWLADPGGWLGSPATTALGHYRWRWVAKRTGGHRLLEAPKPRLACVQRRILDDILHQIPTHEAAHGFVRGRNPLSHVQPHTGQATVLRLDLSDFFPSISRARIDATFRHAGYPFSVARLLACLCTTTTPTAILDSCPRDPINPHRNPGPETRVRHWHRMPHLPQGSPASPALANLAAFRLDCRLQVYARSIGAVYTRYADDLLLSGGPDLRRSAPALLTRIGAILLEEGFHMNWRKVRVQAQSVSQRAVGLVLNSKPAIPREEFDRLKAILHNIARSGSASQNRDAHPDFQAHLRGRIAHVEHIQPHRGARLRALFERIPTSHWETEGPRPVPPGPPLR